MAYVKIYFWLNLHDDALKWKHFPRYRSSVPGIHRLPVDSPHKVSDTVLCGFLWSAPEQAATQRIETPVIWYVIALIITSLWCHYLSA